MMTWLSAVFVAALMLAQVAFGWMPCCCTVASACCAGTGVPAVWHGIYTSTCPALNGLTVTFTQDAITPSKWNGSSFSACSTVFLDGHTPVIQCLGGTASAFQLIHNESFVSLGSGYECQLLAGTVTSASCSLFQLVYSGTMSTPAGSPAACPYAGSTWTLTVTA